MHIYIYIHIYTCIYIYIHTNHITLVITREQVPLNFEKSVLDHTSVPIAPAPKYKMTAETVEIKKEMGTDKLDGTKISTKMDGSAKKVMDATAAARAAKRRNERKEILQRQISENTAKMNIIKKSKNQ